MYPQLEAPLKASSTSFSYKTQSDIIWVGTDLMDKSRLSTIENYRKRLDSAGNYGEVWDIVKDSVDYALHRRRGGMMLFLDDLSIQLGAYHPIGTNNIVLNRTLVQIVEAVIGSKRVLNALVYNLLMHEYLHALGEYSEMAVKELVIEVAKKCFGDDYITTQIAVKSPWSMLKGMPLERVNAPKRFMEVVKDFEKTDKYVV